MTEERWIVKQEKSIVSMGIDYSSSSPPTARLVMKEEEWLAANDFDALLNHPAIGDRDQSLQLLACACYRLVDSGMENGTLWAAVDAAERYADGLIKKTTLDRWATRVRKVRRETQGLSAASRLISFLCTQNPGFIFIALIQQILSKECLSTKSILHVQSQSLLRDIFGNPFRPINFNPVWLTSTAVAIAQGMYESRDFSAMPILADALQDAGCDNDDILTHCRDAQQVHVRGCWVVDHVLGKS